MSAHLTHDELRQWTTGAAPALRARIVEHLATCDECGARAAAALEVVPDTATAAFTHAGRQTYARVNPRTNPAWMALAAAAVLAVAGGLWYAGGNERAALRGGNASTVALDGPAGAVGRDAITFRWSGGSGDSRLRVFEVGGSPSAVIDRIVPGLEYSPAPDERARFQSGRDYEWFVERRGPDGRAIVAAASRFAIQ